MEYHFALDFWFIDIVVLRFPSIGGKIVFGSNGENWYSSGISLHLDKYLGRKNRKRANCSGIFMMSKSSRKITIAKWVAKIIIASRVLGSINYMTYDAISSVKVTIGLLG